MQYVYPKDIVIFSAADITAFSISFHCFPFHHWIGDDLQLPANSSIDTYVASRAGDINIEHGHPGRAASLGLTLQWRRLCIESGLQLPPCHCLGSIKLPKGEEGLASFTLITVPVLAI
jgi:hypothetical protein